jgi:hypothetical protein
VRRFATDQRYSGAYRLVTLFLILSDKPVAEGTTEDELQALLDTLASPLLGVLHGSKDDGYRVTTSAKVAQCRIEIVAQQLSMSEP